MSVARDVTYLCPYSGPSHGVLKVTNYQLHFRPTDAASMQGTLSVPLGVVSVQLIHSVQMKSPCAKKEQHSKWL